jgi:hypothetical protein
MKGGSATNLDRKSGGTRREAWLLRAVTTKAKEPLPLLPFCCLCASSWLHSSVVPGGRMPARSSSAWRTSGSLCELVAE